MRKLFSFRMLEQICCPTWWPVLYLCGQRHSGPGPSPGPSHKLLFLHQSRTIFADDVTSFITRSSHLVTADLYLACFVPQRDLGMLCCAWGLSGAQDGFYREGKGGGRRGQCEGRWLSHASKLNSHLWHSENIFSFPILVRNHCNKSDFKS